MAGKGHPPLATSHYPLASESHCLSRPDQTSHPPPHPCTIGLTSISQGTRVFSLEPAHVLHSQSKIPSQKLSFPDTFRTLVAPNPDFPEILTHLAGKGYPPLATSHYPLAPKSRCLFRPDKTYHPPPQPCTMGLTSISQGTRVFPLELPHGLHSHLCGLQCPLGRQLPKADTAGRILALYKRFQQEIIISRHFSYPRSS